MKILLTGGTGLLGRAFVKLCTERGLDFFAPSSDTLDVLDFAAADAFIKTAKPDLIIHCAAYTAVDLAETEQEKCWALNVGALENLLIYKIPIVHFSSDYVFDAPVLKDGKPFVINPDYPRAPLNFYGESKVAAEEALENSGIDWWNIRTTWLYSPDGEGFPEKIKERRVKGEALRVVNDQYGRKTLTTDLAQFVLDQVACPGGIEPRTNIHYQSPGPIHTWYDWACEIVNVDKVEPIKTEDLDLPAKRPKNSVLL